LAPELAREELKFEVFSSDLWLAQGRRVVALHFPGQTRTILVKTLLWVDGSPARPPGSQAEDGLSELGWDGHASEKQPKQSADPEIKRQKG